MPNINRISVREAFNNDNGKTSGNKLVGMITCFVCLFIFIACVAFFFITQDMDESILKIIDKDLYLYTVGCGLMGVKTIAASIGKNRINFGSTHNKPKHNIEEEIEEKDEDEDKQ